MHKWVIVEDRWLFWLSGKSDTAGRGGIDATHKVQMGESRGPVVVLAPREVLIWLAWKVLLPLTIHKWVIVEDRRLFWLPGK